MEIIHLFFLFAKNATKMVCGEGLSDGEGYRGLQKTRKVIGEYFLPGRLK